MKVEVLQAKISRGIVTASSFEYEGSITIDSSVMEKLGVEEYQVCHVNGANGNRAITYILRGPAGSGCLEINGALSGQIITCTITANAYTVIGTDYHINVDDDVDATGAVTINLPAAASSTGRILHIKKIGNSYNVTLDGNASETIDDSTTQTISTQYDSVTIMCDGTAWWIQ